MLQPDTTATGAMHKSNWKVTSFHRVFQQLGYFMISGIIVYARPLADQKSPKTANADPTSKHYPDHRSNKQTQSRPHFYHPQAKFVRCNNHQSIDNFNHPTTSFPLSTVAMTLNNLLRPISYKLSWFPVAWYHEMVPWYCTSCCLPP